MRILNRNKENAEQTAYYKCKELINGSTVPTSQMSMIMDQIQSIIDELEAIGQNIDPLEIVTEVLEQNEYEFINSKQFSPIERTVKIKASGREIHLTNEEITKLNFNVKVGGLVLDLREFEYISGDLLLNIKSSFSGIQIYINENVAIHDWIENKYSGVDYHYCGKSYSSANMLPKFDIDHTITLEGKIKGSGVSFIIGHKGEIAKNPGQYGKPAQQETDRDFDTHLDDTLNDVNTKVANKLRKIEETANKRCTRVIDRVERKKFD